MSKAIKRWINESAFEHVVRDFKFLVDRVNAEQGELDLRLRDNYFNLYYKGNSLAKVRVGKQPYVIEIHHAFAEPHRVECASKNTRPIFDVGRFGDPMRQGGYCIYTVPKEQLHAFLSKNHLNRLFSEIKKRNYGEEIAFEQMLITDNLMRKDFVIIDRQVQGGDLGRDRLDLLALRRVDAKKTQFGFIILEVKLGNNPELRGDVAGQLRDYTDILASGFQAFKACYEKTYAQMKALGLLSHMSSDTIEIVKPVEGVVVVGGYSRLADEAIGLLRQQCPGLQVRQFKHRL